MATPSPKQALVQEIQDLVGKGRAGEARSRLWSLTRRKLSRQLLLPVAALARRSGLPGLSLQVLGPVVRPPTRTVERASDAECAEYGAALVDAGAVDEGTQILEPLDTKSNPQVLLYRAFALFSHWNYEQAVPLLEAYIESPSLESYPRHVGMVNLTATLVHLKRDQEASHWLARLRKDTRKLGYVRLFGNSLELSAQHAIRQGRWKEGETFLKEAEHHLRAAGGLDMLFVRKWRAVATALRTHGRDVSPLREVKHEAMRVGHWETSRECDFFEGITTGKREPLERVYFGTPYASYRARLTEESGLREFPETYLWKCGGPGKDSIVVDLATGTAGASQFGTGSVLHRLVSVLARDFYRPQRLATLHSFLYPNEFFNPQSSPNRVHQALTRLKRFFFQKRIPLTVEEDQLSYRLSGGPGTGVLVYRRELPSAREAIQQDRLKERFGGAFFTARQAAEVLGGDVRSAQRHLKEELESGNLVRTGSGPSTKYRFRS